MLSPAAVVLALLALPVLLACLYLGTLAALSRRRPAPAGRRGPRFAVVVPAHDEEGGVAETVGSLLALDYPRELFRVVVVADNCGDRTAERAAEAGAEVLVRQDAQRRGKGYALAFAFERLLEGESVDAVAVVDADTVVAPNLLAAFAARLALGAGAMQAEYGVRAPEASWRTRLLRLAFALFHDVRSRGRERLGLSCGLRGNGMAFSAEVLRRVPHQAFSVVEDLEYGLRLGLAGVRVWYVGEARVLGDMAVSEQASRSQRRRWEGGRLEMARRHALALLARALRERSALLLDLALDLLVPPLTYLVLAAGLGLLASLAGLALGWATGVPAALFGLGVAALLLYLARGLALSGLGWGGLLDLARAPAYVAWKLLLLARPAQDAAGEWVRTTRERRP